MARIGFVTTSQIVVTLAAIQAILLTEGASSWRSRPHHKRHGVPSNVSEYKEPLNLYIGAGPRDTDRVLAYILKNVIETKFQVNIELVNATYTYDQWIDAMTCKNSDKPICQKRPMLRLGLVEAENTIPKNETRVISVGELGPRPRLAWFFPSHKVMLCGNNIMQPNNWLSYTNQQFASNFTIPDKQLERSTRIPGKAGERWCNSAEYPECDETGQFIPERCRNTTCATVLAAFPQESYDTLRQQINRTGLFVKAAWVGRQLYNLAKMSPFSPLYFDYTISQLFYYIKKGELTEVLFPRCDTAEENGTCFDKPAVLRNLVTSDLIRLEPQIYRLMQDIRLSNEDYRRLMNEAKKYYPIDDCGVRSIADYIMKLIQGDIDKWIEDK